MFIGLLAIVLSMKTHDKILDIALRLFNERGVGQVSSRVISQEMGISYGNLTYHFPKKKDIVLALYANMQREMEQKLMVVFQKIFEADFRKETLKIIFQVTLRYKFIYLNMVELLREFEEIRQNEHLFYETRQRIVSNVIQDLIRAGLFVPELPNFSYERMVHGLDVIFQLWLVSAEIFFKGNEDEKIDYYITLLYNTIIPHLTPEGMRKFEAFKE